MHEIVHQLVEQAKSAIPLGIEVDEWIKQYNYNLARLIVKECLSQVDKIRDGLEADGEDQQALGADWAGLAVARHFGVEQ